MKRIELSIQIKSTIRNKIFECSSDHRQITFGTIQNRDLEIDKRVEEKK